MKAYILSIAGAVLLSAVVTVISPSGKMGKFVKGTMKLLILAVMVAPFVSFAADKTFSFTSKEIAADTGYLQSCAAMLEDDDEKRISDDIFQEFSLIAEADVKRGVSAGFPLEKISVKITNWGIFGQDEHINIMDKIKASLEKKYACPAEVT